MEIRFKTNITTRRDTSIDHILKQIECSLQKLIDDNDLVYAEMRDVRLVREHSVDEFIELVPSKDKERPCGTSN